MTHNFIIWIIENIVLSSFFYGFYLIIKKIFNPDYRSKIFLLNLCGFLMLLLWFQGVFYNQTFLHLKFTIPNKVLNYNFSNYAFYLYCFITVLLIILKLGGLGKLYSFRKIAKSSLIDVFPHIQPIPHPFIQLSKIKIYFSSYHQSVSTYGVLKPIIIFPIALFNQLDYKQAEYIVQHELAHIYHLDFLKKIYWEILSAILCFNPIVWLFKKEYLYLIELRADAWAVQTNTSGLSIDYIKTLVRIADFRFQPLGYTVPLIKTKSELQKRIEALIFQNKNSFNNKKYAVYSFISMCVLLMYLLSPQFLFKEINKNHQIPAIVQSQIIHTIQTPIEVVQHAINKKSTKEITKNNSTNLIGLNKLNQQDKLQTTPTLPLMVDAQTENPINADELIAKLDELDLIDFNFTDKVDSLTAQSLVDFYRKKISEQAILVSSENSALVDKQIKLLILRSLLIAYQNNKEKLLSLVAESKTKILTLSQSNELTSCISMLKKIDQLTLEIFPSSVINTFFKDRL